MREAIIFANTNASQFGCGENCTCGGKCGCGKGRPRGNSGLGGGIYRESRYAGFGENPYPRLTAVLTDYVQQKIDRREPFYLSPEINSDNLDPSGKGFGFLPILAAIAGFAAKAAPVIIGAAGAKAGLDTAKANKKAANAAQLQARADAEAAAAALKAQQMQIPAAIAPQAISAVRQDAFGGVDKNLLIAGAVALAAILLLK